MPAEQEGYWSTSSSEMDVAAAATDDDEGARDASLLSFPDMSALLSKAEDLEKRSERVMMNLREKGEE